MIEYEGQEKNRLHFLIYRDNYSSSVLVAHWHDASKMVNYLLQQMSNQQIYFYVGILLSDFLIVELEEAYQSHFLFLQTAVRQIL